MLTPRIKELLLVAEAVVFVAGTEDTSCTPFEAAVKELVTVDPGRAAGMDTTVALADDGCAAERVRLGC